MPAEWEPHEATWLSWPKDPLTFPIQIIDKVEEVYSEMIMALSEGERVNVLINDYKTEERVRSMINSNNVNFFKIKSEDVWMRDYGPIFIRNITRVAATKWTFNAWGNKYDELKLDNETGMNIAKSTGLAIFDAGIVLEGGSIDVNGLGSCLTTKQCLLNPNRNPGLSKVEISQYFRDFLGITNLVWLDSGIEGDDTDGHVDDIARFVSEDTVICMVEDDISDENYSALKIDLDILENAKDQSAKSLKVVPVKMPKKIECADGRLPASYANFYIGNSCVLVPTFGGDEDRDALSILQHLFPNRKVLGINCEPLVYGFGGIHCVTQQQPRIRT
ncbi:MAG: agmatine deiminase family protein [Nitrososphaerales archaeon]